MGWLHGQRDIRISSLHSQAEYWNVSAVGSQCLDELRAGCRLGSSGKWEFLQLELVGKEELQFVIGRKRSGDDTMGRQYGEPGVFKGGQQHQHAIVGLVAGW